VPYLFFKILEIYLSIKKRNSFIYIFSQSTIRRSKLQQKTINASEIIGRVKSLKAFWMPNGYKMIYSVD